MTSARIILVAALALAVLGGCGRNRNGGSTPHAAPAPADLSGGSLYDLDLELHDAEGRVLPLSDLRDTVRVAAMMYTNCTSVCPRITHDMKGIERQLSQENLQDVRFVMFSLDPERDSPAALRGFAEGFGLDRSRWRLFSTSEEGVRDLAAVLGVRYKQEEGGEFAHSAMIFVFDRAGVVRHRQVGLNADAGDLIAAVRAAR